MNADAIEALLREGGFEFTRADASTLGVNLPGERRLKTTCWLTVGQHGVALRGLRRAASG